MQGPGQISVNDLQAADGNEGLDALHDVETLQFGDGVQLQAMRGEVRVNSTALGYQLQPTIAGLSDGGFVVTWMSGQAAAQGIYAQRYDAAGGAAVGSSGSIPRRPTTSVSRPSQRARDGGYVVTWILRSGRQQLGHLRAALRCGRCRRWQGDPGQYHHRE